MPLPENLSFVEGAAIPVGWLTAWHALHTVAPVSAGQRVLIETVGGSVGSAALQIAREAGCWTAVTASLNRKLARAKKMGADLLINYQEQSISKRVMAATDRQGADVSLMSVGRATAEELFKSMAMDAKVVMFGSTGGKDIKVNLGIGTSNLQLLSMSISTSPAFVLQTMADFKTRALPLFAEGRFRPVVDKVLPWQELARAHEMIDQRGHFGKVILEIR